MDERLLIPATRALVEEWCGPVVTRATHYGGAWAPWVVVNAGGGTVTVASSSDAATVTVGDVFLDLSRAECRDRVARVLADIRGIAIRWTTAPRFRYGYSKSAGLDGPEQAVFWDYRGDSGHPEVPGFSGLNPNDDTRLPDGSRLVDALAIAAVARQVLR